MDKDLNPVGDYDYLPLEFYDTIHLRALKSTSSPHHWLVRRAGYRAVFDWTQQRSSLDLTSMIAVFKLELFRPQQQIEFPWDGNNASVKIVEARLAGQPIELIWNADRTAFFLTVPSAGVSQLEFVLLPTTVEEGGGRRLQFPIPPISQSQLRIQTPFDAPDIQVVTSVGEVLMDAQSGEKVRGTGARGIVVTALVHKHDSPFERPSARRAAAGLAQDPPQRSARFSRGGREVSSSVIKRSHRSAHTPVRSTAASASHRG